MPEPQPDRPQTTTCRSEHFALWSEYAVLMLIVALGLVLRLQHLGAVTSWFDESFGWRMAQFSPSEIIVRCEQDVHPPMYFFVLHVWAMLFGSSLLSLRSCAVLFGELTLVGAYVLTRSITTTTDRPRGNAFAALLAALFVALSPPHVYWAQQIKMYTFGTALALWSTWLLLSWFQNRADWRLWLYVPLAASLALQHHYGAFTVFGQLTFALAWAAYRRWKYADTQLIPLVFASWATTALWSLWLPSFLLQRNQVRENYWIRNFDWQSIVNVWTQLFSVSEHMQPSPEVAWTVGEIVWAVMVVLLVRRQPGIRCVGWLALAPYLVAVLWSSVLHNVLVARYLVFAHVFLLAGGAVLIGSIPSRWFRWTIATLAIVGMSWTAQARWSHRNAEATAPGMPEVVRVLRGVRSTDELTLVCNPMLYLNVLVHGADLPNVYAFDPGHRFPHYQGTPVMKDTDYCNAERVSQSGQSWVWTIDAEEWLGGNWKVHLAPEWKLQNEQRVREWYATLVLRSYRREAMPSHK